MKIYMQRLWLLLPALAFLASAAPAWAQEPKEKDIQKDLVDRAQNEYRLFFKEPRETHEFWAAIDFEVSLGKFELAGFFLKKLLEKEPKAQVDQELVKLYDGVGSKPFLRLKDVKKWSDNKEYEKECRENADLLVKRIADLIEKSLSDPERIRKYIALLDAPTKKERDNAFVQLKRSGEKVIPYLLDTIIKEPGKPLRARVIETFVRMDRDISAPLYEILKAADDEDAKDTNLRLAVLEIYRRRADFDCIPYLWHMSNSAKYPIEVREAARSVLSYLREEDPAKMPSAKWMLTQMAEKCFQHKLKVEVGGKRHYPWDGRNLADQPDYLSRRKAEYLFGLRYAREALDLDPGYKPAQAVLLKFFLERTFDSDLDKYFFKPMPADLQQLMIGLEPEFLMEILEKAMNENNVPIMLPIIDILGLRGELRAAQSSLGNPPRALIRGLYYPDRRVQFATVNALMKMPYRGAPADAIRVVEVLSRFLAAEEVSRTLVALCPKDLALKTEDAFKMGMFESVDTHAATLAIAFEKLRRSADYDVIFIHPAAKPDDVPYLVSQLRSDPDQGRLPLIILASKDNLEKYRKLFERHPNTWVELDSFLAMREGLKRLADEKIDQTGGGYNSAIKIKGFAGPAVSGFRLSMEERKKFAEESMRILWQMGRGEIPGYNVRHAQEILRYTLHRPEKIMIGGKERTLAELALETAALNPDRDTQIWLANVFFDAAFDKLKLESITELRQHIQKNGLNLEKTHIANLKDAQKAADTPPPVRLQLTLIMGTLRFSPQNAGKKLNDFNPPVK